MSKKEKKDPLKPFEGVLAYYSGSMKGVPEPDPEFPMKLVQFMIKGGAKVLSEHVASRSHEQMFEILERTTGISATDYLALEKNALAIKLRRQDLAWVDEATHMVCLGNGFSHGVGMELQHVLLKPQRGFHRTPILFLIREDLREKVSPMITGIDPKISPEFKIATYQGLSDAEARIQHFLTSTKSSLA